MQELQQLLDFRELTGQYIASPTVGDFYFTNNWYTPRLGPSSDVLSDEVELVYFPAANTPAPLNRRGAASRVLTPSGGTKRFATLFYAFNSTGLPADCLTALRNPEAFELQQKGRQSVATIIEHFRQRHAVMKEATLASIMANGVVNIDGDGNILTPTVDSLTGDVTNASGTVVSADFAWSDNQRGNLNDSNDGGAIIDNFWSNSSAMISRHLERMKYRSGKNGRVKPTEVLINSLNKKHLRDNAEFQTWAVRHNQSIETVLRGDMIQDLWGFNWHFVDGGYTDANGTYRDLVPISRAIVTPKPDTWLRAYRGSSNVPKTLDVVQSLEDVVNAFETVFGQAAWAKITDDPVGIAMYMADAFGLGFADPTTIYAPTVFDTQGNSGTGQ